MPRGVPLSHRLHPQKFPAEPTAAVITTTTTPKIQTFLQHSSVNGRLRSRWCCQRCFQLGAITAKVTAIHAIQNGCRSIHIDSLRNGSPPSDQNCATRTRFGREQQRRHPASIGDFIATSIIDTQRQGQRAKSTEIDL